MLDLSGKRVLVTGASGGIGGSIAKNLHKQGAFVVLSGTNEVKLSSVRAEIGEKGSAICPCNLMDEQQVDQLVDAAAEKAKGPIEILVSNAGMTKDGLLMRMKDDDFSRILKVNLEAYFRLCRAAVKPMMKARTGRIIGVSSVVGVTGNPGQTNYAASKAGMIGFTKSLAAEIGSRGITANIVAPGFVDTEMTASLPEAVVDSATKNVALGRFGSPDDIAAAVAFLASDEASYITGATLHVNGGLAMI